MQIYYHCDYDYFYYDWKKIADFKEGSKKVKFEGEEYLPKLSNQTESEYFSYKNRAMYVNFTSKIIAAISGQLLRKEPIIKFTPESDTFSILLDNITSNNKDIYYLTRNVVNEVVTYSRCGLLVDLPQEGGAPYVSLYNTFNIINWKVDELGNLIYVLLREEYEKNCDEFLFHEKIYKYRLLYLDENKIYKQKIYFEGKNKQLLEESEITPIINGINLNFIPFQFIGAENLDADVNKPFIIDVVDISHSHYMSSANYEQALFLSSQPTPVITGFENKNEDTFLVGSNHTWCFGDPNVTVNYLEASFSGINELKNSLDNKEVMIAKLGSRILSGEKNVGESAESKMLNNFAEKSILENISINISNGILNVLYWMVEILFPNNNIVIDFALNKDFDISEIDPSQLSILLTAYEKKIISFNELYLYLVRKEIIDVSKTQDILINEINNNPISTNAQTLPQQEVGEEIGE